MTDPIKENPANDNAPGEAAPEQVATTGKCPQCSRPRTLEYRPFCSKRCADIDLARWLGGAYAIPVAPTDADDEE